MFRQRCVARKITMNHRAQWAAGSSRTPTMSVANVLSLSAAVHDSNGNGRPFVSNNLNPRRSSCEQRREGDEPWSFRNCEPQTHHRSGHPQHKGANKPHLRREFGLDGFDCPSSKQPGGSSQYLAFEALHIHLHHRDEWRGSRRVRPQHVIQWVHQHGCQCGALRSREITIICKCMGGREEVHHCT